MPAIVVGSVIASRNSDPQWKSDKYRPAKMSLLRQSRLQSQAALPATFMEHLLATKRLKPGSRSFVIVTVSSQAAPPSTFMEHLLATKRLKRGGRSFVIVTVSSGLNCSKICLTMVHFTTCQQRNRLPSVLFHGCYSTGLGWWSVEWVVS